MSRVWRQFSTTVSAKPIKQFVYTSMPLQEKRILVPATREGITTPKEFLGKIGRRCDTVADKFKDWDELFTCTSEQMEGKGIKAGMRKYILGWREWFKRGKDLEAVEIAKRQKKHLKRKEQNQQDRMKRVGLA